MLQADTKSTDQTASSRSESQHIFFPCGSHNVMSDSTYRGKRRHVCRFIREIGPFVDIIGPFVKINRVIGIGLVVGSRPFWETYQITFQTVMFRRKIKCRKQRITSQPMKCDVKQ